MRLAHRFIGLCLALPIVLLALTGLPLQFTDQLALGTSGVRLDWVHESYGISSPQEALTSGKVTQVGDQVFVGGRQVSILGTMVGAVEFDELLIIATNEQLTLVPNQIGVPIEQIDVPAPAHAIGRGAQARLVLRSSSQQWVSDDFGLSWLVDKSASNKPQVAWASTVKGAASSKQQAQYRGAHVSWERLLQDLHSGRLFGAIGEWVMNFAGFALIILALTGAVAWWRGQRQ